VKAYKVIGAFRLGKGRQQGFTLEMAADDKEAAIDKILSTLGSRHRIKRREIMIESLEEIPADSITNSVVKYQVGE